jgi:hypothetical protein
MKIKAGVVKDITNYSAGKNGPFWIDSSLVRFINGYAEKIGGWQKDTIHATDTSNSADYTTETSLDGIARNILFWRAESDGEDRIIVGSHSHLYVIENGAMYDVTPLRDVSNTTTTLTEDLDDSETSIDITSITGLPAAGAIKVNSEIITYTGISTLTLTGCTRGTNSTSAATHDSGATVTATLINPIATTDGSTTVTITDTTHGATSGDYVVISGATATGGITTDVLNRSEGFEITVTTANAFTITVPSAASSTVSAGGGLAVAIKYLVGIDGNLGTQSGDPALGWGVGGYGSGTWGTPRSASESDISLEHSVWSLNLWDEDIIATVRGGAVYYYDTSDGVGNRAVLISDESGASGVPSKARVSAVSFPDRHVILGGTVPLGGSTMDPMLIRWSDQETFNVFTPTTTNTAGDQRLEIGNKIITMQPTRDEMLIFTDEAVYGMSFVGAPFIFAFRLLATGTGAGGKNVVGDADGTVYWMGKNRFFKYDGVIKELPCSVQYFVFNRMQEDYIDKTVIGHNRKFKEIIWFYVSTSNTAGTLNPEPDSYVTYNYQENVWAVGTLNRTVWHDSFGARTVPFAFDETGILYDHETGTSDNGSDMNAFIESSPMEITSGGNELFMVDKVVPDVTLTSDTSLFLELKSKKYPNATEVTKGPFTISSTTTKLSTRAKGRQIAVKLSSTGKNDDWAFGDFRINTREDGLR